MQTQIPQVATEEETEKKKKIHKHKCSWVNVYVDAAEVQWKLSLILHYVTHLIAVELPTAGKKMPTQLPWCLAISKLLDYSDWLYLATCHNYFVIPIVEVKLKKNN